MRYQLLGPWPVGQFAIPASAVLDGKNPNWGGYPLPTMTIQIKGKPTTVLAPPLDAMALDQEAYDALYETYSRVHRANELHFDHTVVKPKPLR